ncbi:MAG: hypothetical protein FWF59_08510 [Turicibacter sp.]|nr:hypothetical protein [Turicibacter sp.]
MELFRLLGKIAVDGSAANKEINKVTGNAQSSAGKFGKAFSTMAKVAKGAIAGIVSSKVMNSMIRAADEFQSNSLSFNNVFRDNADHARDRMNTLAADIGKLPGRLKPTFTNMSMAWMGMGRSADEAMDLVTKQTMMAADAAAFKGLSVEDANRRMANWIKGSTAAGFELGLTAHQADIAAWAATNLGVNFNELGNEQRKLIRMQFAEYFFENAGVLGFAAENSRNLYDSVQNLRYAWRRLLAIPGAYLLNLKIDAVNSLANALMWLVTRVDEAGGMFQFLRDIMLDTPFGPVAAAIGGLLVVNKVTAAFTAFKKALMATKIVKSLMTAYTIAGTKAEFAQIVATTGLTKAKAALNKGWLPTKSG